MSGTFTKEAAETETAPLRTEKSANPAYLQIYCLTLREQGR